MEPRHYPDSGFRGYCSRCVEELDEVESQKRSSAQELTNGTEMQDMAGVSPQTASMRSFRFVARA